MPEPIQESLPRGMRLAAAWSWRLLVLAGAIAVFIFLIIQLRLIVIPLLVAVLLSALLRPVVTFLTRHRWPKGLAIASAMVATLAVVAGLITLASTQIALGSTGLSAQLADSYQGLKGALLAPPFNYSEVQLNDFIGQLWSAIQSEDRKSVV